MLKRWLAASLLALLMLCGAAPAFADNVGCMPVTGQFTAVQEQQKINAALFSLRGLNSGAVAPTDDCSGAPIKGQLWLNTASTPYSLEMWDGTQWDLLGAVDPTNGLWLPIQGGGIATATAASVLDLCAGPPATPQNEITISGTTPITSFGASCKIGQFKFLKFASSVEVTYNSGSILTPNNQNIYAENGGRALVLYLGSGVWDVFYYHGPGGDVPVGTIQATTSTTPDPGYLLCDGTSYAKAAYPNLFNKIGYAFGGTGANFNVPDLRGRVMAGLDNMGGSAANRITNFNADSIGAWGGTQSQTIAQVNLPNVNFPLTFSTLSASGSLNLNTNGVSVSNNQGASVNWTGGSANGPPYYPTTSFVGGALGVDVNVSISGYANSGGSSTPVPTLPPTQIVAYEIKY